MGRRYQSIVGGPDRAAVLYLILRRLGIRAEEWRRTPWHDQQVYLDGLLGELEQQANAAGGGGQGGGRQRVESFDLAGSSSGAGFAALGIPVERV